MSKAPVSIRVLGADDLALLRPLRLDALRLHPEAYGSSFEEESQAAPDDMARRLLLPPTMMFGAFAGSELVGMTGLLLTERSKQRHIGHVFAVYVAASHRGAGVARALIDAALAEARLRRLLVVQLHVTVGNAGARRLYAAIGFRSFGVEHRALCVEGRYYDTEYMALDLD